MLHRSDRTIIEMLMSKIFYKKQVVYKVEITNP
jgi:hypothetical protein